MLLLSTPTIAIHYYYSAQKVTLILLSHRGQVESTCRTASCNVIHHISNKCASDIGLLGGVSKIVSRPSAVISNFTPTHRKLHVSPPNSCPRLYITVVLAINTQTTPTLGTDPGISHTAVIHVIARPLPPAVYFRRLNYCYK